MAARTVPSNSYLLSTSPHSMVFGSKNPRQLTVCAKKSEPFSFRLGKTATDDSLSSSDNEAQSSNPFQFNWGKISDVRSLIPVVSNPAALGGRGQKDAGTVFVAGATGQAGVRISQMLLREGFRVRAGVPDLGAAQELARLALDYKIISADELRRLNAVQSMFEDAESVAKEIGNASKVVVTIGSAENGPTKQVTTSDALKIVEAAQLSGVRHLAIIYDDSAETTSTGNVLDGISSFFNNLFSKSQPLSVTEFLQKVIETDVKFTFIRAKLTEDFSPERSYNVVVGAEGSASANDYKIATSQMAALVAELFSNTEVAEDKVVDVYADPSAPSQSLVQLFSAIPEDGRRKAYAEAIARAEAEEAAMKAAEQAREAADIKMKLQEEVKKLQEQEARATDLAEEAKQKAEEAGASVESLLTKAKDLGSGLSWEKFGSQLAGAVKSPNFEIPKVQIATVRGQAKAQSLAPRKAVVKQTTPTPKPKPKPKPKPVQTSPEPSERQQSIQEQKKEVRNIFGGMFKQETIYIDDA